LTILYYHFLPERRIIALQVKMRQYKKKGRAIQPFYLIKTPAKPIIATTMLKNR